MIDLIPNDEKSVLEIKTKLWRAFDALRPEVQVEDYYVILFLLSLHKDKVLKIDSRAEDNFSFENIETALLESDVKEPYKEILEFFQPTLNSLSSNALKLITQTICDLDHSIVSNNFPELFDSVLFDLSKSQGKMGGESIQPLEITRLINRLSQLPKDAKVYNPFAGLASFALNIQEGQYYFGQEFNPKTHAIGALRLMAHKKTDYTKYVCNDSISSWPDKSQKFDLIVSNPPFRFRIGKHYGKPFSEAQTTELFLIEQGIKSLKSDGKLIAVLPVGFLFNGGKAEQLRKKLVDEDILDTIISLPGGLLYNTGIPVIILIINNKKDNPGKVRLIKADAFVESKNGRIKVLNDRILAELILKDDHSFLEKHPHFENSVSEPTVDYQLAGSKQYDINKLNIERTVKISEIQKISYNLNVPRYFQEEIPLENNEKLVKLKDILEYVRGLRGNLPNTGKLVRIRDLKDDKFDSRLNISEIEEVELRKRDIHQINETCLLLAIRWQSLKPTYFDFDGTPIYKNQDILSFKVNESIADYRYLINELHADYVQEQLEAYRMGTTIPYIRKDDLLKVAIKLPSLQEQKAKVKGIFELSDKLKMLREERNALAHGKTLKQFSEFASLKHTLGRPRQNILDWSDNLLDFLSKKKEGFEVLNNAFTEFYDIDIISALKEIKRDVNFITDVLEKGENGLVLSDYEKKVIPLSDINSIISDLSNNGLKFKIKKLLLEGEKLKERGISANKTLFRTLLDNILTNANKYAFDSKNKSNEVVIELAEVDDYLAMEIRNNGKSFPKNFDREKFITKYSTADSSNGSGLGGYDIHRIACDFNNPDWILALEEDPLFRVKFKFQYPIKLIN